MKLQDLRPGMVVWNYWEYSIMGRDTGTKSSFFIILDVGEIKKESNPIRGKFYDGVTCKVRGVDSKSESNRKFDQEEIEVGRLRLATKAEIQKLQAETSGIIRKKILEHKTQVELLEIDLSELEGNYKEFIEKAI